FEGAAQSGRTALAKITFSDLLTAIGCVPIFIDGRALRAGPVETYEKRVTSAVQSQYSPEMVDRFNQIPSDKRALIVDNWHLTGFQSKGKSAFLSFATARFGRVFLFSDPIFTIQEFATQSTDQKTMLQFQYATIPQFGYKARGRLIEKWLSLGR